MHYPGPLNNKPVQYAVTPGQMASVLITFFGETTVHDACLYVRWKEDDPRADTPPWRTDFEGAPTRMGWIKGEHGHFMRHEVIFDDDPDYNARVVGIELQVTSSDGVQFQPYMRKR